MKINADWSQPALVHIDQLDWQASPLKGVDRKMLERDGDEVALATSVVRYAPNSFFDPHIHAKGEEFLVLDGVFSDESGDFPAGTYVRNPPGSGHRPESKPGCTILVKLRYMTDHDTVQVVVDTLTAPKQPIAEGVDRQRLYQNPIEQVEMLYLAPSAERHFDGTGGEEIFLTRGSLIDAAGHHPKGTWMRRPAGSDPIQRTAGREGAVLWRKTGYLAAMG